MCQGLTYCDECENSWVKDYGNGESHYLGEMRGFGDAAQRQTAIANRQRAIFDALNKGGLMAIADYPETATVVTSLTRRPFSPAMTLGAIYDNLPGKPFPKRRRQIPMGLRNQAKRENQRWLKSGRPEMEFAGMLLSCVTESAPAVAA